MKVPDELYAEFGRLAIIRDQVEARLAILRQQIIDVQQKPNLPPRPPDDTKIPKEKKDETI